MALRTVELGLDGTVQVEPVADVTSEHQFAHMCRVEFQQGIVCE